MEAAEGESTKSPEGGEKRPKRKMKTAYQLELLEKTYAGPGDCSYLSRFF